MKTLKYAILFLWQILQNVVALVMIPFLGRIKKIDEKDYVILYECSKMKGAITLGNFIFLSHSSAKRKITRMHELGHSKQSKILGPLFLFVIGIPSIMWAWLGNDDKCYYSFYTEAWANKISNLRLRYINGKCYPTL